MVNSTAVLWGSEPPAFSIGLCEPMWPGDSGFSILFADAPDPNNMEDDEPGSLPEGISVVHLGCLLEEHPELGRGLDIAREHGVADLDENDEWVAGDASRLEDD